MCVFLYAGFDAIFNFLNGDDLDAPKYAALILPLGNCAQFLNDELVLPLVEPGLKAAVKYVQELGNDDLKQKVIGALSVSNYVSNLCVECG